MAVDLSQDIPNYTDGVDHWRRLDVNWIRDRTVLRVADRTVIGSSSSNQGQVIFSRNDQTAYVSATTAGVYNWKGLLASSKLSLVESADPEIRLSSSGTGSGITWKANQTIAVTNLQVANVATIGGALSANSLTTTAGASIGTTLAVGTNATVAGNLTVTGSIIAGSLTGSTSTAAKLATPRQIALSGDVTGSTLFDGSANVTIATTVGNTSIAATANSLVRRDASGGAAFGGSCSFGSITAGAVNASSVTASGGGLTVAGSSSLGTVNASTVIATNGFTTSGTCNFSSVTMSGTLNHTGGTAYIGMGANGVLLTVTSNVVTFGPNVGTVSTGGILSCGQVDCSGSILGSYVNASQSIVSNRSVGTDWSSASFIAQNGSGPNAAYALRTSTQQAQIRLGGVISDLYFRDGTDANFINLQAAAFLVGSSVRYKDDIQDLGIEAVEMVQRMRPVSWRRNDGDTRRYVGFTAEELYAVWPEAVGLDDEDRPHTINTQALDTLALTAIQQLAQRVQTLEAQLGTM